MTLEEYTQNLPPILKKNELNSLIVEYQKTKDITLRNKILSHNLRLAANVVSKYFANLEDFEVEDLVQIANIELVSAIDNFSPERGSFSTFVSACIKNRILNEIKSSKRGSLKPDFYLYDQIGTATPLTGADDKVTLINIIKDDETPIEKEVSRKDSIKRIIAHAKKTLKPLDFEIFKDLFLYSGNSAPTLTEIAKKHNTSHQVIAQKKDKFKAMMRTKFIDEWQEF